MSRDMASALPPPSPPPPPRRRIAAARMASRIALTPWPLLIALLLAACPAFADIITFNATSFHGTVAQSPGAAVFLAASLGGENLTFTWTANNTVVSSVNLYRVGSSHDVRIGSGVAQSSSDGGGDDGSSSSSATGGATTSTTASATAPATTTESTTTTTTAAESSPTSSSPSSPSSQPAGISTGNSGSTPLSGRKNDDRVNHVDYPLTVFSDSSGGSVSIAPESYNPIAGNFSTLTLYFEALWDGGVGITDSRPFVFASSAADADTLAAESMYENTADYNTEVVPPGYNPSSSGDGSGSSGNNGGGNSSSTSGTKATTDKSGLSSGAKAGIVVGCVLVGLLLLAAAAFFLRRRRGGARNRRLSGLPDDLAGAHIMTAENLLPRRSDPLSLALISTRTPTADRGMPQPPRFSELFGIGGGRTRSQQQHEDLAMAEKTGMSAAAAVAVAEVDSPQSPFSDDTSFGHQARGLEQQENQPQQNQQQHQQQQQLGWAPNLPQPQQRFGPDFVYQVGESDDTAVNDIGVATSGPDAAGPQQQQQEQQQPTSARGSMDRGSTQPQQEQAQQLQTQQLQQRQQQQPGERGDSAVAGLAPGAATAGRSTLLSGGVYAHLVEEGMTPDELRRLEEEERALDEAIEQRARK